MRGGGGGGGRNSIELRSLTPPLLGCVNWASCRHLLPIAALEIIVVIRLTSFQGPTTATQLTEF